MEFAIRPYHPSDLVQLYRICLLTGDSGQDASSLYLDPDLLGHYYAAPYAVLEPELCFILTADGVASGYILGTQDSVAFAQACEREWFAPLRQRYPKPQDSDSSRDANLMRLIHQGHSPLPYPTYPAELHIDLLPLAQGQGLGRRLIEMYLDTLRQLEVPGVHLGVGKRNTGAMAFYQRLGFELLADYPQWASYGLKL